jgi:hypothetical protein
MGKVCLCEGFSLISPWEGSTQPRQSLHFGCHMMTGNSHINQWTQSQIKLAKLPVIPHKEVFAKVQLATASLLDWNELQTTLIWVQAVYEANDHWEWWEWSCHVHHKLYQE